MPYFVQFLHPGGEHQPDTGQLKRWNTARHQRKFLLSPGRALRQGNPVEGDLVFWAEWEAESEVTDRFAGARDGEPGYLYIPYYVLPASYTGLQNTDPFVFGGFYYGICQQNKSTGPTTLHYLDRGSVVLFGSCLSDRFVLDTVFVVKDWIDYAYGTVDTLEAATSEAYRDVTIRPLFASGHSDEDGCAPRKASYRLCLGATMDNPMEGMFSFFPTLPRSEAPRGFRRPTIQDARFITDTSRQGYRLNPQNSVSACSKLWTSVVEQVYAANLCLGTSAALPERRSKPDKA